MLNKPINTTQLSFLQSGLKEQLSNKHPLYILADHVNWQLFDDSFKKHYKENFGRPAKPIRLMVALLMLKHIRNLSDESVVEQWAENAYYQYFSGEQVFTAKAPCEASELVHFRNRIGEEGVELIFKESIRINGKGGKEDKASIDTTVQEKNITYPTDSKLHRKIIKKCIAIADKEGIELRQRYTRTLKKPGIEQRFRNHPKNGAKARKADKKVKTIAGRLVRELQRKLPAESYKTDLELFVRVLRQKRQDKNKFYSLHEPDVACISKGKEHKKYEFGSKVSITVTQNSGVIIGALNIPGNDYDGHTLDAALEQQQRLTGHKLKEAFVDRGYRGRKEVLGTTIHTPKTFSNKLTAYRKNKLKEGFTKRAAIEPKIGHLKTDHRLSRNFYITSM
ncbi:IS5 family transposase [Mucilaginibacter oryzae]|uniref:IS5 family transposase n=1 Tax=Mucilaginibacter oryzae TaxID=468058 RepID=A0A316H1N9_9SPHI|nr:IS5 family transposase [Mucilaginibacter oryzae]PWK73767.1 IS5 family transposase [Mucilaginibacter oryzae]